MNPEAAFCLMFSYRMAIIDECESEVSKKNKSFDPNQSLCTGLYSLRPLAYHMQRN